MHLSAKNVKIAEAGEDSEQALTIRGNLNYEAKNEIADMEKATITGEVKYLESTEYEENMGDVVIDYIFAAIGTVVFDLIMYIAISFFAPKFVEKAKDYASTKGLLAFAIGIAFTILVPFIALLLCMIGVGAGTAVLLLLLYAAILMVNAFAVTLVTNEFIASKLSLKEDKLKKGLLLIPVSLVIWALRKIPFIGSWISIIVFLCGVGIVILYQFDRMFKGKNTKTE